MCSPAAAVDSHAGRGPEQTGGTAAPILSAKGPELWYCRELGTALLGKGLMVMAGQEFGSQDVFLSNPRKELPATRCSHSSVTSSSLLILWYICLLYFWTLLFISSVLLWVLVPHRIIFNSLLWYQLIPTRENKCHKHKLLLNYSTRSTFLYHNTGVVLLCTHKLHSGSWIHSLQPISGLGPDTSAVFKTKRIQNFALKHRDCSETLDWWFHQEVALVNAAVSISTCEISR